MSPLQYFDINMSQAEHGHVAISSGTQKAANDPIKRRRLFLKYTTWHAGRAWETRCIRQAVRGTSSCRDGVADTTRNRHHYGTRWRHAAKVRAGRDTRVLSQRDATRRTFLLAAVSKRFGSHL